MSNECHTCGKVDELVEHGTCEVDVYLAGQMRYVPDCGLVLCESCGNISGTDETVGDVAAELLRLPGYCDINIAIRREIAILLIQNTILTNTLDNLSNSED